MVMKISSSENLGRLKIPLNSHQGNPPILLLTNMNIILKIHWNFLDTRTFNAHLETEANTLI